MNVKPYLTSIILGLVLTACGSDNNKSKNVEPEIPLNISVSGKVIDGYLKNAKVCLDANNNLECDASEPQAVTDNTGTFQILTPDQSLVDSARLVAEANTETIDLDSDKNVTHPFTFIAKSNSPVITPFTSLIEDLVNKGHDYDSAKMELESLLKLDVDVDADYIEKANDDSLSSEQREHYQRLHTVAKLATVAISHNLDKLLPTTEHDKKEVLKAVYHKLTKTLDITSLEATFFQRNNIPLPDVNFLSKRFLQATIIKPAALTPLINITKAHEHSVTASLTDDVTTTGIHSFNSFVPEEVPSIWYEQWLYNKTSQQTIFTQEIWSGFGFNTLPEPFPFPYLVLNDGSFEAVAADLYVQTLNENGSITFSVREREDLYATMTPKQIASNALPIHAVLADHAELAGWNLLTDRQATFSEQAKVYDLTFTKDYDYFILPNRTGCVDSTEVLLGICNTAKVHSADELSLIHATTFDHLISEEASNGDLDSLKGVVTKTFGNIHIVAELTLLNQINLYTVEWQANEAGEIKKVSNFFDKGKWKKEMVDGLELLSMKLPKHSYHDIFPNFNRGEDDYNNFLVLQAEKLRWGKRFKANRPFRPNQYVFNLVARNEILAQTKFEKLTSGESIVPKSEPVNACRVGDTFASSSALEATNRFKRLVDFNASLRNCVTTTFAFSADYLLNQTLRNYDYNNQLQYQLSFLENENDVKYGLYVDYTGPAPQQMTFSWQIDAEGKVIMQGQQNNGQAYFVLAATAKNHEYISTKLFYEHSDYSPEMDQSKGKITGRVWTIIEPIDY